MKLVQTTQHSQVPRTFCKNLLNKKNNLLWKNICYLLHPTLALPKYLLVKTASRCCPTNSHFWGRMRAIYYQPRAPNIILFVSSNAIKNSVIIHTPFRGKDKSPRLKKWWFTWAFFFARISDWSQNSQQTKMEECQTKHSNEIYFDFLQTKHSFRYKRELKLEEESLQLLDLLPR